MVEESKYIRVVHVELHAVDEENRIVRADVVTRPQVVLILDDLPLHLIVYLHMYTHQTLEQSRSKKMYS